MTQSSKSSELAQRRYLERMGDVMKRIDAEPETVPNLETISAWAGYSPYHLHRQFRALTGVPLHRFVQLSRLHRAGMRLAFVPDARVTEVAMDAGYETPEAFARTFRRRMGQSPSAFRKAPDWPAWQAMGDALHKARSWTMHDTTLNVEIRDVMPVRVAVMDHRGDPASIGETIRRFIAWRREAGFPPTASRTFNLFWTDPRTTRASDHRVSLCASVPAWFAGDEAAGVSVIDIPGGRCAVLAVGGPAIDLEEPALRLYRDWLPASGETPRDFPLFCERVRLYPQFTAAEALTELMLPIA